MIYFIADTHFGHENIIKYEDRPFETTHQMNEIMIGKWNEIVSDDDIVFHLGDFALTKTDEMFDIFNRLNGHKYLVFGNHDGTYNKYVNRMGFKDSFKEFWFSEDIVLSHRPQSYPKDILNIHGHIHAKHWKNNVWNDKNHICVSTELINYKPVTLTQILKKDRRGDDND